MVAIAGMLMLKEHITKPERVGIALALLGTLIITVGPMVGGNGMGVLSFEGNLLIIISLAADAIATVIAKVSLRDRVPAMALTNISFMIGFVCFLPFLLTSYSVQEIVTTIAHAPLAAHLGVLYMAFISGTVAYTLQKLAMKSIEVGEVAIFNYLFPIWAAPLALWWLGEKITLPFVIGAAVIATGVVIAEYKGEAEKKKITAVKFFLFLAKILCNAHMHRSGERVTSFVKSNCRSCYSVLTPFFFRLSFI